MIHKNDIEGFRPPVQRLDMPYQVLERTQPALQEWLSNLLRFALRQAPYE